MLGIRSLWFVTTRCLLSRELKVVDVIRCYIIQMMHFCIYLEHKIMLLPCKRVTDDFIKTILGELHKNATTRNSSRLTRSAGPSIPAWIERESESSNLLSGS